MKKQIVISRVLEFGGSNAHLKLLLQYFGTENVILVLDSKDDLKNLKKMDSENLLKVVFIPSLKRIARFRKKFFFGNLKELFVILVSLSKILLLSIKNGRCCITISSIEPEKHLYLFWLPLVPVNYIMHATPWRTNNPFSTITCNLRLSRKKKIITVSMSNRESIIKSWKIKNVKKVFVEVIYNCYSNLSTKRENYLSLFRQNKIVLTMGHVEDYKNPHIWLKVAKAISVIRNDVHFFWLGNGSKLEEFTEATKGYKTITFCGLIKDPTNYLHQASIYYQPSLAETHGIAVVEAMSNSLPCIVSNVGGLVESVIDRYNGIVVNPKDLQENIDAVLTLVDDDELNEKFGKLSYERYQQLFTYDSFKKRMDLVYEL